MANHYIASSATGTGTGADWTNAYIDLPSSMIRGDTYFIATGNYGGYTFDDGLNGTLYITIAKATPTEHGTETGWVASYGIGTAQFDAGWIIVYGNYIFDGKYGGGASSWTSGHGITIKAASDAANLKLIDLRGADWWNVPVPDNLEFRHMNLWHRGQNTVTQDDGIYSMTLDSSEPDINARAGCDNVLISYCYLHDFGRFPIQTHSCTNWLMDQSCIARNSSSAEQHSEGWQDFGSDNMVIKNSYMLDCTGTGFIVLKKNYPQTNYNWKVYGNIFVHSISNRTTIHSVVAHGVFTQSTEETAISDNLTFYHNTVINIAGWVSGVWFPNNGSVDVRNNLWYFCDRYPYDTQPNLRISGGDLVHDYNLFSDSPLESGTVANTNEVETTGDPFTDWENEDYTLSANTFSGEVLDAEYNIDMYGSPRTTRSVGAIEYGSEPEAPAEVYIMFTV